MKESFQKANEELKRIDHLVYVTLKYTRTVDVLISILKRMINSYEFAVDALLKAAEKQEKIENIPEIPLVKAQKVKEIYKQKIIQKNIDRYLKLRKLIRSNYEKSNEYRRHVTMTSIVDGDIVKINIDIVSEMFDSIRKFIDFVHELIIKND
ncbi:hypothetical protein GF327_06345 [Candidatus Woesearchaeota archaeon]|nr:hypothetical protein [Candidatus Woesearchaeota archaeon]